MRMTDSAGNGVLIIMKVKIIKRIRFFLVLLLGTVISSGLLIGRMTPLSLDKTLSATLQAEIKGEVNEPGVYTLKRGDSLKALIQAASGTTEQADLSAFALLDEIEENEVVVIPARKEKDPLISINTAEAEELQKLSGIGPTIAQKIIDYRREHPFQKLEDIMEVKGIGPRMFEKIREKICL